MNTLKNTKYLSKKINYIQKKIPSCVRNQGLMKRVVTTNSVDNAIKKRERQNVSCFFVHKDRVHLPILKDFHPKNMKSCRFIWNLPTFILSLHHPSCVISTRFTHPLPDKLQKQISL